MTEQIKQKGKKWGTIAVPQEAKDLIERIKSRSGENKASWKIVVEALSYYDTIRSKPKVAMSMDMIEKVSWYITKLSLAYGSFATNPTEETTAQLISRLQELEMKTHIDTGVLQRLVAQYTRLKEESERKRARIEMNQAFKLVVKELMMKAVGGEENDSA